MLHFLTTYSLHLFSQSVLQEGLVSSLGTVAHTAGPYPYLYMRHEMTWSIAQTPGWDASPF